MALNQAWQLESGAVIRVESSLFWQRARALTHDYGRNADITLNTDEARVGFSPDLDETRVGCRLTSTPPCTANAVTKQRPLRRHPLCRRAVERRSARSARPVESSLAA